MGETLKSVVGACYGCGFTTTFMIGKDSKPPFFCELCRAVKVGNPHEDDTVAAICRIGNIILAEVRKTAKGDK